jgi:glutathione S-transferase
MKLLFGHPSPYSRKVRVALAEKGLNNVEQVAVSPFDLPAELIATNPLSKVPALILDDGSALYDSQVICEYLDSLGTAHQLIPAPGTVRWTVLRRHALCDGILDATFAIACEINRRPPNERSQTWIERWRAAVDRSLYVLDSEIMQFGKGANLAHIAAGCALSYLDLRAADLIDWRGKFRRLKDWHAEFEKRPSMHATHPAS